MIFDITPIKFVLRALIKSDIVELQQFLLYDDTPETQTHNFMTLISLIGPLSRHSSQIMNWC